MWSHPKLKNAYVGNYEYRDGTRVLRLEYRNARGITVGKVHTFTSHEAAKKEGWVYKGNLNGSITEV